MRAGLRIRLLTVFFSLVYNRYTMELTGFMIAG